MTFNDLNTAEKAINDVAKAIADFKAYRVVDETNEILIQSLGLLLIAQGKKLLESAGMEVNENTKPLMCNLKLDSQESAVFFILQKKYKMIKDNEVNNTQIINGIKNAISNFEGCPVNDLTFIEDAIYDLAARAIFGCLHIKTNIFIDSPSGNHGC